MDVVRRMLLLFLCHLCLFGSVQSQSREICNNTGLTSVDFYERRPNSHYCYRLFQTVQPFSAANKSCARHNGLLVRIDSEEENGYIFQEYFNNAGRQDFWIGLTDQNDEGVFRWVDGNSILLTGNQSYNNWVGGSPAAASNEQRYDCVKFTSDGWMVENHYCESTQLSYLCRQRTCNSTNGLTCSEPTVEPGPAVLPEIIAVIVIIVVIIIAVVAIIISLLLMWKYRNDAFYRYILCCVYGGSKTQVNNLKQENIRLRNELSQQKLNLNASGHLQGLSRQNSVAAATSPTTVKPVLGSSGTFSPGAFSASKMPQRSLSLSSNKMPISVPLRSPQASNSVLPMGRSMSMTSAASLPIRTPIGMGTSTTVPILPSIKEKPASVKPTGRPSSVESSSSSSSGSDHSIYDDKDDQHKEKAKEEKIEIKNDASVNKDITENGSKMTE